ncbi:two-component system, sensor histidine kinase LadS [Methylophilaceae bacterium]|nr:two-component system, sensor histidine kinase LadS [Methylophilaceae bacterium]
MTKSSSKSGFTKAAFVLLFVVFCQSPFAGEAANQVDPADALPLAECLEYVEDSQKQYSIADMATATIAKRFAPANAVSGQINFGYSNSAYWLRCDLSGVTGKKLLEIAYPALDNVQVFMPDASGTYRMQEAGDIRPFDQRPYPHRNFVFPIEFTQADTMLYIRAESRGTLTLPIKLWSPETFHEQNQQTYAVLSVYYGIFVALALYNLFLFISIRDRVYLEYVLFVIGMAIGQASLNGFGNQFLWPDWPAWGNIALPTGFAIAGLFFSFFTRSFLALPARAPRLNLLNWLFVFWFVLSIMLHFFSYQLAAMAVSFGGLGYSLFGCWVGWQCMLRKSIAARYYLLALTLVLVGVGVMAARNFGWLPTNLYTMYAMQVGSSLEMLLLSFALADRINLMQKERNLAQAEALEIKQKMLETLKHNEQELETRVKLRTFELEAANQLLLENEQKLAKVIRQDSLTGLGNRMALDSDFDAAVSRARRANKGVALALIDLDGFKPVNDTYGHEVGDTVLKEIAERLSAMVRKTDSVIRIGGDEFVIIIEDIQSFSDVKHIVEKLLASLKQPMQICGSTIQVGASIGVSLFPDDGETLRDLLHKADMLMYEAKTMGGNRCQASNA